MQGTFLYRAVKAYLLKEHGVVLKRFSRDVVVQDDAKGEGAYLAVWAVKGVAQPSMKVLKPYIKEAEAEQTDIQCRAARAKAYPDIGEQLDALWKGFAQLKAGGADIGEADALLKNIQNVKRAYPKKQECLSEIPATLPSAL